jgi:hypothetical protein
MTRKKGKNSGSFEVLSIVTVNAPDPTVEVLITSQEMMMRTQMRGY